MDPDVIDENRGTEVGSYFIANYPPFSAWSAQHIPAAIEALDRPSDDRSNLRRETPLGLYLHVPFCRKRCKFCYYRVYTEKNSSDVKAYLDALAREVELYAQRAALSGRELTFVYFGGGTPSFLSSEQLRRLMGRISANWQWESAREVTFECEPGTLRKSKLETIKAIGTTRLSLGVEHFDDEILSLNGRAHKSAEIFRAYAWAREVDFDQINLDLIAGLLGETEAKWNDTVGTAIELQPDSVTIYQMELPHNTTISREARESGTKPPIASWATKREWVDYAFRRFEQAGYVVSSAYTLVKAEGGALSVGQAFQPVSRPTGKSVPQGGKSVRQRPSKRIAIREPKGRGSPKAGFVYRDSLWHGADMIGTGVASFSHVGGVHFQNSAAWDDYIESLGRGELPIARAHPMTNHQRLTREMILQLKLGRLDAGYFRKKFDVEITKTFDAAFGSLVEEELAAIDGDAIRLTRAGLLRVDALLPRFFERNAEGR